MKNTYEVNVGNIGSVYEGTSLILARDKFKTYVEQSENDYGRAAGETVAILLSTEDDCQIIDEYVGRNDLPDHGDHWHEEDGCEYLGMRMWSCGFLEGEEQR